MKQIYPNYKEPKFSSQLQFEIVSWLGRHFQKRKSRIIAGKEPLLLDIGVGTNFIQGWTHVDFFTFRIKFWKTYTNLAEVQTDLRYPLNCHDDIVDGVYSGHTLEHLYPNHAYFLIAEIYRILKPGGWLRINVPDLEIAIDYYMGKNNVFNYTFKAEAIANLTQNSGHHSVWNEELLKYALETSGFVKIKKVEFGIEGTDKRLIKENKVRKFESIAIEAQKPF